MRERLGKRMSYAAMLLGCVALFSTEARAGTVPEFVAGDRWCVLGDSITHGGTYHREVELFYLTRFPDRAIEVINCGISGDTAKGALQRLRWDCLDARPTVVTIMLGMNDISRGLYEPGKEGEAVVKEREAANAAYETGMRSIIGQVQGAGARVTLVKPSIFDDTAATTRPNKPGLGAALAAYGERMAAIAAELNCQVVDFATPLAEINRSEQKADPEFSIIGLDRVHPGVPGHFVMACSMLRAQGVTGTVSRIEVDAGAAKATGTRCVVSEMAVAPGRVSFTALEEALPFPMTDAARPALKWIPFGAEFNQQVLVVSGLAAGRYQLKIDDEPIRQYTAVDLGTGVNLADEAGTPQMKQAVEVRKALQGKWDAVSKLRTIAFGEHTCWPDGAHPIVLADMVEKIDAKLKRVGTSNPYYPNSYKAYFANKPNEAQIRAQVEKQVTAARAVARPKPHKFVLEFVPAK